MTSAQAGISQTVSSVTTRAGSRGVASGTVWGLLNHAAVMLASLIATPFTIRLLGAERYGVYGLLVTFLGNAAFVDFGMSTATTFAASKKVAADDRDGERAVIWSALLLALPLALPAVMIGVLYSPSLERIFFHLGPNLASDAVWAIRLACFVVLMRAMSGILNTTSLARLNFRYYYLSLGVSTVGGVLLAPLAVYFVGGVSGVMGLVLILASTSALLFLRRTRQDLGSLFPISVRSKVASSLFAVGAGAVLFFVAETALTHLEKYMLSTSLNTRDLAHYLVAFTFGMLLVPLPLALSSALFPAFSRSDASEAATLGRQAATVLAEFLLPLALMLLLVCGPFLTLWAGREYAATGTWLGRAFVVGQIFAVFAYLPASRLQSLGRTRTLAALSWGELLVYPVAVFFAIKSHDAYGASVVWGIRSAIHFALVMSLVDVRESLWAGMVRGLRNVWPSLALMSAGLMASVAGFGVLASVVLALLGLALLSPIYFNRLKSVSARLGYMREAEQRA